MQKYKQKETHKFTGSDRVVGQRKVREKESDTGRKKLEEDADEGRRNTNVLL